MSDVLTSISLVIFAIISAFLMGLLISYLARIPQIRKRVSADKKSRWIVIVLLSLITLVFVFTGSTRLFAGVMHNYVEDMIDTAREDVDIPADSEAGKLIAFWEDNKSVVLYELWLRQMTPPRDYYECRSKNLEVCDLMGNMGIFGGSTWGSFLLFLGMGIVSAMACGFFTNRVLHQKDAVKSVGENEAIPV
jgi:hypothetical protein